MRREFSAGVIIYYQSKSTDPCLFLLLKYPSGYWDLAKGKIEKGETFEQTALREVKEETGLDIELDTGFHEKLEYFFYSKNPTDSKDLIHKEVTFFVGQAMTKKVTISFEHQDFIWLDAAHAYEQLTFKNAKDVFKKVLEYLKKQQ